MCPPAGLRPSREPFFDEFLRTQQGPRRHPRHLPGPARAEYCALARFSRRKSRPSPAIAIAAKEPGGAEKPAAKAPEQPIETLLASASVEKGQTIAKQCQACHTFDKGGPNRVGPNLYGIVGRARGSHPGFNYSAAMKAKGGTWTYDELNKFLTHPQGYIPGTAMTFAGLSRETQRADVIDYLHTLADNPEPLPKAAEAAPAPAAAQAGRGSESRSASGTRAGKVIAALAPM